MAEVPRPLARAPEYVGPDESPHDVAHMTDRGIATMALDATLRVKQMIMIQTNAFLELKKIYEERDVVLMKTLSAHEKRLERLEQAQAEEHPDRHSSHEWDKILAEAGTALSQRVKDPRDRLDSDRARKIAEEVAHGIKNAEDAQAFRNIKLSGWKIVFEVLKVLAALILGAAATHWGIHGGSNAASNAPTHTQMPGKE